MNQNDVAFIQNQIGYKFKNSDLLQQAFVRRSYSQENGGEDNEVLEFIGDKVLDLIVVKLLIAKYGFMISECDDFDFNEDYNEFACDKNESHLTEIKNLLVQKEMLAKRIDILGLADYLIMGKGDHLNNAQKEKSVKEDLFEAILGAIAIDSNWDMTKLQSAVEIMLDPDTILNDNTESNYVALIQEWFIKEYNSYPQFYYDNSSYYDENSCLINSNEIRPKCKRENVFKVINTQQYYETHFKCWINLFDKKFIGYGISKSEARKDVCELLYSYLNAHDLLFTIKDEITNPNKNNAINQLETLARRGYFSIPTYKFDQRYAINGNPVWICECHIKEKAPFFTAESSSKKDAKKSSAYKMLQHVLRD